MLHPPPAARARPAAHARSLLLCSCLLQVVAAYLLAALGGNAAPKEADIKKILSSGALPPGEQQWLGSEAESSLAAQTQGLVGAAAAGVQHASDAVPSAHSPAVGIEAESERVAKLLSELEGKDVNEVGGG